VRYLLYDLLIGSVTHYQFGLAHTLFDFLEISRNLCALQTLLAIARVWNSDFSSCLLVTSWRFFSNVDVLSLMAKFKLHTF